MGMTVSSSLQEKTVTRNVTKRKGGKIAFIDRIDLLTLFLDSRKLSLLNLNS